MRKFILVAQLIFGAFSLLVLTGTPLNLAVAREGQEHEMVTGEVKKIDESAGKITLKHGPITDLGMNETMTMVWTVKDAAALKGLRVGDKVMFHAESINGQPMITEIEKAK